MENNSSNSRIVHYLEKIEPYYLSGLVLLGLVGNSISFIFFLFAKLKYIKILLKNVELTVVTDAITIT